MASMIRPFHLAISVSNLEKSRQFYKNILGCSVGRSSDKWIDFNFFKHQLVIHQSNNIQEQKYNSVDGHDVPIPHFGVILTMVDWKSLADRLKRYNIVFIIEPCIRFKGLAGEQATMFFSDPSGNSIEFKAFRDLEGELFKK